MTAYKLRPGMEAFEVVDGPYAGKKYKAGIVYRDVPPQERHRFEPAGPVARPRPAKAKKAAPAAEPGTTVPEDSKGGGAEGRGAATSQKEAKS